MPGARLLFSGFGGVLARPYITVRESPLTGGGIDQLNQGTFFNSAIIHFQFPDLVEAIPGTNVGARALFAPLSEAQRAAAREVFAELNHLLGVRFVEWSSTAVTPPLDGNIIRIANTSFGSGGDGAQSFSPGNTDGTIWMNGGGIPSMLETPVAGEWLDMVMRHEIGHSLGLSHPHDLYFGGTRYDWGNAWTIMSYSGYGTLLSEPSGVSAGSFPQTFMPLDIQMLQHVYGRNTVSDGNDVYRVFTEGAVADRFGRPPQVRIISEDGDPQLYDVNEGGEHWLNFAAWDSGGSDSLDFSGVLRSAGETGVSVRIDADHLRAWLGPQDPIFVASGDPLAPRPPAIQFVLDDLSWIETLVGTASDDHLDAWGADRSVSLNGGGGGDTLIGGRAADRLTGDEGGDLFRAGLGGGHDIITDYNPAIDRLEIWGFREAARVYQDGGDVVLALSDQDSVRFTGLQLAQLDLSRVLFGAAPPAETAPLPTYVSPSPQPLPSTPTLVQVVGTGSNQADWLQGVGGRDFLFGGFGDDFLEGMGGDDILRGSVGRDRLEGGDGADSLYGGTGDDRLSGGNGDDVLEGEGGDDLLVGDAGFDTAIFQGRFEEYLILFDGDDFVVKGRDGSDRVRDIERLRFDDGFVELTGIVCAPGDYASLNERLALTPDATEPAQRVLLALDTQVRSGMMASYESADGPPVDWLDVRRADWSW